VAGFAGRGLGDLVGALYDHLEATLDASPYQRETGGTEVFHRAYTLFRNGLGQDAGTHLEFMILVAGAPAAIAPQMQGDELMSTPQIDVVLRYDIRANTQLPDYHLSMRAAGDILRECLRSEVWAPESNTYPVERYSAALDSEGLYIEITISFNLTIEESL
jgi:hypothetical protein